MLFTDATSHMYLWTRDVSRAHRFARDLEAGMIWITMGEHAVPQLGRGN